MPSQECNAEWSQAQLHYFSHRLGMQRLPGLMYGHCVMAGRSGAGAGRLVFSGPREEVVPFFSWVGLRCPERKNIADFVQEVCPRSAPVVHDRLHARESLESH